MKISSVVAIAAGVAFAAGLGLHSATTEAGPPSENGGSDYIRDMHESTIEPARLAVLRAVYPGAELRHENVRLSDEQTRLLESMSGAVVVNSEASLYRAESGGRLLGVVTFFTAPDKAGARAKVAVATSADGRIEMVVPFGEGAEALGDAVLLAQFAGKRAHSSGDWVAGAIQASSASGRWLLHFASAVRASSAIAVVAADLGTCSASELGRKYHGQRARCAGCSGTLADAAHGTAGEGHPCCLHCAKGRACGCPRKAGKKEA